MVEKAEPHYGAGENEQNGQVPVYRNITVIYNEARAFMEQHGIEAIDKPNFPPPQDPGSLSVRDFLTVRTNMFGIKFDENFQVHRYHLRIKYIRHNVEISSGSEPSSPRNGPRSSDESSSSGSSLDESSGGGNGQEHDSSVTHSTPENGETSVEDEEMLERNSKPPSDTPGEERLEMKDLSEKRARGDCRAQHFRNIIRVIFEEAFKKRRDVFCDDRNSYYFDLASTLYSINKLPLINGEKTLTLESSKHFLSDVKSIIVYLKETKRVSIGNFFANNKSELDDLQHYVDNPLMQFMEIASSQSVLFAPDEYVTFPSGKVYLNYPEHFTFTKDDIRDLRNGCQVGIGAQKSIRLVEGPQGRGFRSCAVVVANKKTPFHASITLAEKAYSIGLVDGDCRKLRAFSEDDFNLHLSGLFVEFALIENGNGNGNSNGNGNNGELKLTREPFMRVFRIDIYNTPATKSIQIGERDVLLIDYYRDTKGHVLKYPHSPLAEIRVSRGRVFSYPLETLLVYGHQRVTTEKQTSEMISELIKISAIVPSKTIEQIDKNVNALQLIYNPYLNKAGVEISRDPLKSAARHLLNPDIVYGGNEKASVNELGTWNTPKPSTIFIDPKGCQKWVVTFISDSNVTKNETDLIQEFVKRFTDLARNRGMNLPAPLNMGFIQNNFEELQKRFESIKSNGVEFAFFVTIDRVKNMHDNMKLLEGKFELVTQDLNSRTMESVVLRKQYLTLENILMKTNVKLGGLNHVISIKEPEYQKMIEKDVLYIGLGTNHPSGGMRSYREIIEEQIKELQKGQREKKEEKPRLPPPPPTVVGFAANDGKNFFEFTGDYIYQPALRDEKVMLLCRDNEAEDDVPVLQNIIETILTRFINNRGIKPSKVVVYRNGCSEGQFLNILLFEVPLIKHAMKKLKCENAKLTFIIPNKLHNIRLQVDPDAKAPQQNINPGYVTDTAVTNPNFREFYLCSHTTLQGTAKIPRYTILYTDDDLGADDIQQATYALSYGHQIVRSPTSIPSPVYIADAYAERGRKMVNAFMATDNEYIIFHNAARGEVKSESERLGAVQKFDPLEQNIKIWMFNRMITLYNKETLRCRRINA